MSTSVSLIFALVAASPSNPGGRVAAFQCGTTRAVAFAQIDDITEAYGQRSVSIIQAAVSHDMTRLNNAVAPDAKFVSTGRQSDLGILTSSTGPQGAIEFAERIRPQSYEFRGHWGAPIDPCGKIQIELSLKTPQKGAVSVATFVYEAGVLTFVRSDYTDSFSGTFVRRSHR